MTKKVWRPGSVEEVEAAFEKVTCDRCPLGWHLAGFAPAYVECRDCDPVRPGQPRRHMHQRKHPRRRIVHLVDGRWTTRASR